MVYRALTARNLKPFFAIPAMPIHRSTICCGMKILESQGHPDMARRKSQPLVEALRVDTAIVRQQFDELATPGAGLRDGPLHQLLSNAAAAAMGGDANVLDQAARGALRTQSRQDAELQATDDGALPVLRYHKVDIRIGLERLECPEIGRRQ